MGAWIEIILMRTMRNLPTSHPTMGAWIEISEFYQSHIRRARRTPRWVRGLKLPALL